MRKVVLMGYMGAGKSVVAAQLAQNMQCKWVDLDGEIEKVTGTSITDLFEKKGELYFRRIEHEIFTSTLVSPEPLIISTGGGTPCYFNNHLSLQSLGVISFYLKASIPTLVQRLKNARAQRPLLSHLSDAALTEYVAKHLFDRSFYYQQATHTILVDGKSVDAIVTELLRHLT